jgi:Zn-dependent protease with chaperone function
MASSEAYRVMRRRADAGWRWLAAGGASALAGGVAAALAARHLPVCFWVLRELITAQQAGAACWGVRLTTGVCAAAAAGTALVLCGQWLRTAFARGLRSRPLPVPAAVAEAAEALGLGSLRFAIACDDRPWALARGFVRPAVVVSSGLLAGLDALELAAVLEHERHHLLRRDPLRLWVARAACAACLWLPPARRLLQGFALASELAADAFAMERFGKRPLASALHKIASASRATTRPATGMGLLGAGELQVGLAARVAQIAAFPGAVPAGEDPWRRGAGIWAVVACAGVWSLLVVCASSLVLR